MGSPAARAMVIRPKATVVVDWSNSMATPPAPSGTAKETGLVPMTRRLPPGGATMGEALVIPSPISPARAICPVKNPSDVAVCAWAMARLATPHARAAASASGSPRAKAGWAKPNRASAMTAPGRGRVTSGVTVPCTRPLVSCVQ
jgi:hypothetical protein